MKPWTALVALALLSSPAFSQQSTTLNGMTINLGVMEAEAALRVDGHREAHPQNPPPGSQHLLITLADAKSGQPIGDAIVVMEITDPKGHTERKPLLHTQAAGLPDYSELFIFPWSGRYSVRVTITLQSGAKPTQARFTLNHSI